MEKDLIVGVMACCSLQKYILQIEGCKKTWVKECQKLKIPTYFFTGQEGCLCNNTDKQLVHLNGVKNDFKSSTYKQWYGLKYMYENHKNAKFYFLIGTDTYINPTLVLNLLKKYNENEGVYLGGHGDFRNIVDNNTNNKVYFHSGGSGFIISNYTMKSIYNKIDFWVDYWEKLTDKGLNKVLDVACDVSVAYFIKKYDFAKTYTTSQFRGCDWKGFVKNYRCCEKITKPFETISCHYMNPRDMLEMHFQLHKTIFDNPSNMDFGEIPTNLVKSRETIVTHFYNIEALTKTKTTRYGNDIESYFKNKNKLLNIDKPLIIFCDLKRIELVKKLRKNKMDKTLIIQYDLTKSPYYCYRSWLNDNFKKNKTAYMVPKTEDFSVLLPLIWNKMELLEAVSIKNIFNSDLLVWADYGIFKINNEIHEINELEIMCSNYDEKKITMSMIHPVFQEEVDSISKFEGYLKTKRFTAIGGLFAVPVKMMSKFTTLWHTELSKSIILDLPAFEEQLYGSIIAKNGEMFNIYYGDYHDLIYNFMVGYKTAYHVTKENLINCRQKKQWLTSMNIYQKVLTNIDAHTFEQQGFLYNEGLIACWYGNDMRVSKQAALKLHDLLQQKKIKHQTLYVNNIKFHGFTVSYV